MSVVGWGVLIGERWGVVVWLGCGVMGSNGRGWEYGWMGCDGMGWGDDGMMIGWDAM